MSEQNVDENVLLEIRNISKKYPGVQALDDINFTIHKNSVHCLVGENGAGKSTLIKILTGAIERTSGRIFLNGKDYNPKCIKDAMNLGISVLYQELNVVDELTVEENLTLGIEENFFGIIKNGESSQKIFRVLEDIDPSIDLKSKVEKLSIGKKQIIEIAKAVAADARIIIMDEPSAALSEEEVHRLFKIINTLREKEVTIIYISHRLDEIFEIGDVVTVLRDGKTVATKRIKEFSDQQELIKLMLGKLVLRKYKRSYVDYSKKTLEVRNLHNSKLKNLNFDLYAGELLGFYGLVGSGKTETARALFGADNYEGEIILEGKPLSIQNPKDAIDAGIVMIPEERRTQGLFADFSIKDNIPVMNYRKYSKFNIYNKKSIRNASKKYIKDLKIVTSSEEKMVAQLSGGNQQKVVLAKCLNVDAKVMLFDEPSRGVDIGAKDEIFTIIQNLSKKGVSSIIFSSELTEILSLCDRIILLYEGGIKAIIPQSENSELDSEKIMHISTGGLNSYENE